MSRQSTLQALIPNAGTEVLTELIELAEADFKAECRRDDVSQSYSGASEAFLTDWPEDLKRAMHRWRKAAFV